MQVFLLEIKANLENVAKISLPDGHEYCIDVRHLVGATLSGLHRQSHFAQLQCRSRIAQGRTPGKESESPLLGTRTCPAAGVQLISCSSEPF